MARITWTPQALDDVEAICRFIGSDAPRYAHLFANQVFKAVERLKTFPRSGRIVLEIDQENVREIILGNYRIIYRILNEDVQILTVYHSARLLDPSQLPL
jgi:addiction module RelE/StbE family toxin